MGLSSIFRSKASEANPAAAVPLPADAVQQARTRARRRLIGAAVLVGIGIIGFPLLFETQPRPIPVDIPIEIPHRDSVPPLVMPTARAGADSVAAEQAASMPPGVVVEPAADVGREVPPPLASASVPAPAKSADPVATPQATARPNEPGRTDATVSARADAVASARLASAPAAPAVARAPAAPNPGTSAESARAQALLEGRSPDKPSPASTPGGARFVVQAGAFADASSARDTRARLEKLGLKTYTQVAETPAGNRIRVRLGPFASRDEADKAKARARAAGVAAVVLAL